MGAISLKIDIFSMISGLYLELIYMKKFKDYQPNQIFLFPPSINEWLPIHAVFVTGDWWFDLSDKFEVSFAGEFGIPVEHNSDSFIIGQGCYQKSWGKVKMVVTQRPEGLRGINRERHAHEILSISSMHWPSINMQRERCV